jgi:hypothetical protein
MSTVSKFLNKSGVGFPYRVSFPLTVVIIDYWLKDSGVSNSVIGLFSLVHWPFTLKFLWDRSSTTTLFLTYPKNLAKDAAGLLPVKSF